MPGSSRRGSREPREPRGNTPSRLHGQLAGCILWLPRKSELTSEQDSDSLEEDRCNHPVVILSPQIEDGKVVYLMITSLKGRGLGSRFSDPNLRLEHIPIHPCEAHPDNGMLLNLEDITLRMRKKSYVKTRNQYRIRLHALKPYERNGPAYVLSRKSYLELIECANFTPPLPHPASNTVTSPRRARSASYGEYVNALRGLEAGMGSPPRSDQYPSIPSVSQTRYNTHTNVRRWDPVLSSERDPLVAVSVNRSYGQIGNYPTTSHPIHTYQNAARVRYQGLQPPRPFDWPKFWKIFKVLFCIGLAMLAFYGVMRGVQWVGDVVKGAANVVKQGITDIGTRLTEFWSGLTTTDPTITSYDFKMVKSRVLRALELE